MNDKPDLDRLLRDLADEHSALDAMLVGRTHEEWDRGTPAEGWTVRDTVSHLAFFDEQATLAALRPEEFRAGLEALFADPQGFIDAGPVRGRGLTVAAVLDWWRSARAATLLAFSSVDPSTRVPWYGPDMAVPSFTTARLMETWAHGQDVADAVGVRRTPTARLRHIAHLGVRTLGFSFVSAGRPVPEVPVHVGLAAPDGTTWSWGPEEAENRVSGSAIGFCLLVSQRRNIADTDVVADGPVADEWLSIAQCFAGPAGEGRPAGLPVY